MGTMDGIIDTVSAMHPLLPLIGLLKNHAKLIMVGAPEKPHELPAMPVLLGIICISYNTKVVHLSFFFFLLLVF